MALQGRVALVTGGGRGIGRSIGVALARAGADVAVAARSRDAIEGVAREIQGLGRRAIAVPCDVGVRAQVERMVVATESDLGPVDILVNSAGIAASSKFVDMDDDLWEEILRINLTGTYLCCKAVVGGMVERRFGRIINVASTAGKVGYLYTAAYCASKHGVLGLTRSLALEVARHGVTVNAICPGWVETDMTAQAIENIAARTRMPLEEAAKALARMSPQQRLMTPDEVAHVAVMLAGDGAGGITGQAINVDGGAVMS